jgi:hypothetical protein
VWNIIADKPNMPSFLTSSAAGGPLQWQHHLRRTGPKELKKERAGVLINFWWSMWKERNLRTFENKENPAQQLAAKIVDSIKLFRTSCSHTA